MNNLEIDYFLRKNNLTRKIFGGVFSADKLKFIRKQNKLRFFIFNTDTSESLGHHWFVIGLSRNHIELFDAQQD